MGNNVLMVSRRGIVMGIVIVAVMRCGVELHVIKRRSVLI